MIKQSVGNYRPFLASLIVSFLLLVLASCGGGGGGGGGGGSGGSGGGDITPPTVSSTVPTLNATGVSLNSAVAATFSEALNPATISTASFSVVVTSGGAPVTGTVSYSGVTATFTPDSALPGSTQFTATLTGGGNIADLAGNVLVADYTWDFTTGSVPDSTLPTVSSTIPTTNATGVSLNSAVAATFSEALNPATISTATFSVVVTSGGAPITGTVTYNGVTATFTPSSVLPANTQLTATLTGGTGNIADLAGNVLAANYVWSFTTGPAPDTTPPTVSSTVPAINATGVSLNSAVAATFSEALNPATISTASFSVIETISMTPITGTVIYNGVTATFTPSSALPADTQLTATLTGGGGNIADLAGNPLAANYSWSFTTGPVPDTTPPTVSSTVPTLNATGVSLNSAVSATFSEALNPATISTASFSVVVTSGGAPVPGTVTYNGVTATFTPDSDLTNGTEFTATLTGNAGNITDLAGNPLATDYVWSFTTGAVPDITPPTVSSIVPADAAIDVSLNSAISATFSEALNPATISTASFSVVVTSGGAPVPGTVTYNGVTATFTPSSVLPGSTQLTATLTGGAGNITDLAGNPLAANYVWSFTTVPPPDITSPTVLSTVPTTNATGVSLNSAVSAIFSEALNPATISTASFTVIETISGTPITGTVTYSGVTATFTPSSVLPGNTQFTATLTGGAGNIADPAGNVLVANYVWSFTTQPDSIPPDVISPLSPVNNATNVATDTNVSATFSEPVVPGSVIFLLNGPGGAVSASTPVLTGSNDFVTINPNLPLANNTTYVATISAARDVAGNNLAAPFSWSFTTVPAPDTTPPTVSSHTPIVGATGVSINSAISIIFSEPMAPATINATNITVSGVTPSSVTYSGVTAVFTPSVNLINNTTYTVTVITGVTDVAGNPIAATYVFSFTTAAAPDTTPPTVSSTVPATNATGISLNSAVAATFSEALDPATITSSTFSVVETSGGTPVTGTVTYNGVTATFAPDSDLAGDTQFTATLLGGGGNIADLAGIVLVSDYIWNFTTGPVPDTTPPTVVSTVPADIATGIAINTAITALFSEPVDPATVNTTNFTVYDETGMASVSGNVTYNGLTATFTPNTNLANSAMHTATLSGVTDTAGNPLPLTTWTFTTAAAPDVTAPTIVLPTIPADTATNVDITTAISATFDEPMDAATLSTATFTVNDDTNTLAVSGTVTYDGTTATFQPSADLAFDADITVTIDGATDLAGNSLPITNWTFTTSAALDTTGPQITNTTPVDKATAISVRPTITIKFSELIDCATLLDSSLSLTGGVAVTFTASCGADTATFIPTSDLTVNTTYTATLSGSITDIAANVLVTNPSIPNPWTFTIVPELWTVQFGSASHDQARGVATDSDGNVYITGSTLGNMGGQVNAGGNDIFLTKYSPAGVRDWTRVIGTNRTDIANALAIDSDGNVYIAGYSRGDLNGETNNDLQQDVAIIKYDTDGDRIWTRLYGTGADDFASAITIDGSDNIYVTGTTLGNFDGSSPVRNGSEFFVLKLDSSGTEIWRTQLGSSADIFGRGITISGAFVFVTGNTNGSLVEPVPRANTGASDVFLARFSTTTTTVTLDLSLLYGTMSSNLGRGIATDGASLYITGETVGGLNGEAPAAGMDAFLMRTDLDGVVQWTNIIGTTLDDLGRGVTVDALGGIYVTGYTQGSFAGSSNAGNNDLFVTKYDTSGATVWSLPVVRQLGSAAEDTARAITTYTTGGVTDVFVVGETLGALDGNVSFGLSDFFAVNYDGATGTKN